MQIARQYRRGLQGKEAKDGLQRILENNSHSLLCSSGGSCSSLIPLSRLLLESVIPRNYSRGILLGGKKNVAESSSYSNSLIKMKLAGFRESIADMARPII